MEDPCQLCITEKPCSRYAMQYVFFQDSERGNGCFQHSLSWGSSCDSELAGGSGQGNQRMTIYLNLPC